MIKNNNTPPRDAKHIRSWRDLPQTETRASYDLVSPTGEKRRISLKDGNRRVFEGLMQHPVFCASPVRLSDRVLILKRDFGVSIRTEMYSGDHATDSERYGVYFLDDDVIRVDGTEVVV